MINYCIIGTGGSGREMLCCLLDFSPRRKNNVIFMVGDGYYKEPEIMGFPVIKQSTFNPDLFKVIVSVGDPFLRQKAVESLPAGTVFTKLIDPKALVYRWSEIGEGSYIATGCIVTCNVKIGKHSQLNYNTTITHDFVAGDYFTTAPGVNISGNCTFGNRVYFGTNACCKEKIRICSDVIIGMGSVVVKDITEPGTYVGTPAKRLLSKKIKSFPSNVPTIQLS